jgi:hypothetical protein
MRRFFTAVIGVVLLAGSAAAVKADSIFSFEDLPANVPGGSQTGAFTPFTETNNGVTATFTSSVPGALDIEFDPNGIGSGKRLIQTDTSLSQNVSLTVSFGGQQFQSANFPFAILAPTAQSPQLTLQALLAGTPIGAISAFTDTDLGPPPYSTGFLNFNPGAAFDSVVLTSNINGFAIDDLTVSPAAVSGVPEPAPVALLLFGMAAMLGFVRHRQQRAAAVRYPRF